MRLNTTSLRYFCEYIAQGSAQKAADNLGISRSAITRNMKALEHSLGVSLLMSTVNGVAPTEAGLLVLQRAREIIKIEDDLRFDFSDSQDYCGQIIVGMGGMRAQCLLPAILPEFRKKYPNVDVQIQDLRSYDDRVAALLNHRMDFLVTGNSLPADGILFEPFMQEELVCVAPKDDPFVLEHSYVQNRRRCIRLQEFQDKPFILGYPNMKSRTVSNQAFQALGLKPKVIMQTQNSYTASILAYHGLGYALVPLNLSKMEGGADFPVYHLEEQLQASWPVGIASLRQTGLSRAAEQLKKAIMETRLPAVDPGEL